MKNSVAIASLTLSLLLVPAGAQLAGQLGVFDPQNADGGINPQTGVAWALGDQYRLAFYTDDKRDAISTDIDDYNAFVQSVAAGSTTFPLLGDGTWKVLGSTETVSALQNTGTESNVAVPIYVLDGVTRIAVDSDDMWNGFTGSSGSNIRTGTVVYSPYLNEDGAGDSGVNHGVDCATGSNSNGTIRTPLGGTAADRTRVNFGSSNANNSGRVFIRFDRGSPASQWSFYALSEPLMVVSDGPSLPFAITEIDYAPDAVPNPTVTLTWRSQPGKTYNAFSSTELSNWDNELADSLGPDQDEIPDDGNHFTVTFELEFGLELEGDLFFRLEEG